MRRRVWNQKPGAIVSFLNYSVRLNDGPNFYILYKDIFIHRIYHFEAQRPDPLILDCGSNIGMSILYFKHIYPRARVIGFEPDPAIFPYLEENVARNGLKDVQLVQAALAAREGVLTFILTASTAVAWPSTGPRTSRQAGPATRCRAFVCETILSSRWTS